MQDHSVYVSKGIATDTSKGITTDTSKGTDSNRYLEGTDSDRNQRGDKQQQIPAKEQRATDTSKGTER